MGKKLLALLFASVLAFPLATAVFAQEAPAAPAKEKAAKEVRWDVSHGLEEAYCSCNGDVASTIAEFMNY